MDILLLYGSLPFAWNITRMYIYKSWRAFWWTIKRTAKRCFAYFSIIVLCFKCERIYGLFLYELERDFSYCLLENIYKTLSHIPPKTNILETLTDISACTHSAQPLGRLLCRFIEQSRKTHIYIYSQLIYFQLVYTSNMPCSVHYIRTYYIQPPIKDCFCKILTALSIFQVGFWYGKSRTLRNLPKCKPHCLSSTWAYTLLHYSPLRSIYIYIKRKMGKRCSVSCCCFSRYTYTQLYILQIDASIRLVRLLIRKSSRVCYCQTLYVYMCIRPCWGKVACSWFGCFFFFLM